MGKKDSFVHICNTKLEGQRRFVIKGRERERERERKKEREREREDRKQDVNADARGGITRVNGTRY